MLVRRGARNVPLLGGDLARLVAGRLRQRFEATDTGVPLNKCDPLVLHALHTVYRWRDGSLPSRLEEAGLLTPGTGTLTVAGALYLLDAPHSVVPKAFIEVFRYRSDEGDYDRRVQIDGH